MSKRKSTEAVPGAQPTAQSDNPLVDGGANMSLRSLISAYALFLSCDVAAHEPPARRRAPSFIMGKDTSAMRAPCPTRWRRSAGRAEALPEKAGE